jgi:hypothetical protein
MAKTQEEINYDQFNFAVGMKYDLKTKNLTFKKVKYIMDEILTDIRWDKRKSLNFQLAWVYIFFLWFLRTFNHYLGQYFVCVLMSVPVTKFEAAWYKIDLEYASFDFYQEALVVSSGVLFNSLCFFFMIFGALVSKKLCNCFPRVWYKIVCWYGVFVVLDPIIILVIDLCIRDFEHGDWFKFYNWYLKKEGNGFVGMYLTFFIFFALTILNGFLLYYYMIFVHMNGRILDLYKRLSGSSTTFFVPKD